MAGDLVQETPEQRLARLLMAQGGSQPAATPQALADALIQPPRNPAAPADWAQNAVRGVAGGLANLVMAPRRAMDQGMTTEEAIPWAGDVAMGMAGASAPFAAPGALGAAGGKLLQPEGIRAVAPGADIAAIKSQLEAALQSKDRTEFPAIFQTLKELHPDDTKMLAKEFYPGPTPRNQKQALDQIWSRWRKLEEFQNNTSAIRPAF